MIKFLILAFFVVFAAHADIQNPYEIQVRKGLSEEQGARLLQQHIEASLFLGNNAFVISKGHEKAISTNYMSGDFVILWGVGSNSTDQQITMEEYKGLWRVMNYLSQKNFRVIMNVQSTSTDLSEALRSSTSSVVLFSSHGNTDAFYDFEAKMVPYNIFSKLGPNLYQFILSSCYGKIALRNYNVPEELHTISWSGLTTPTELLDYLVSDYWTGFEGKE